MLSNALSSRFQGTPLSICRRCLLRSLALRRQQTRSISQTYLATQREAKAKWDKQAELIKEGKVPHLWDMIKARGFVKDIAGTESQIRELMRVKRIGAYVGIDPTAPSLHIGHLLPLMPLFWMYIHGYHAVSVVGGATGKIGDPTGRLQSRDPLSKADITMNITKIHYQLKRIWLNVEAQAERFGFKKEPRIWKRGLYNNSMWHSSLPFVEVVSRLFKGVRLGPMLSRETVKRKMESGDGVSLDEFVYPLMQAWDWWHLFSRLGIQMQIGGSDQFGNIVSGVDCVKHIRDSEPNPNEKFPDDLLHTPVGFTVPLLTDSSGAKFGKSAGNAVWLDPFATTPFDLYGYFMRRPDADVEQLLKLFTFLPMDQINKIMEQQNQDPSKRHAQHALAYEVVALAHGLQEAELARNQHKLMFSKAPSREITSFSKGKTASANVAAGFRVDITLPESLIKGKSISRILYAAGLADSVSDGNRLTQHQGAYVGGAPGQPASVNQGMTYDQLMFTPIKNWFPKDTQNFLIDGKLLILRRGKHFIRVVKMVSDEEWKASGLMYPGEPGTGRVRVLREALLNAVKENNLDVEDSKVMDKLLEGAKSIYAEGKSEPMEEDEDNVVVREPQFKKRLQMPNRAQMILRKAIKRYHEEGPQSAKQKTALIDEILERTLREAKSGFVREEMMENKNPRGPQKG